MKKLIRGIVDFRKNVREGYRETFARLALGQKPDALLIACSDSRVVPNTFASSEPGDLFVIRNAGNLISPCGDEGISVSDESEMAAIEFAMEALEVKDVIICGHSECAAMRFCFSGRDAVPMPHLRSWLRHGLQRADYSSAVDHNDLSRRNVLRQIDHLMTYRSVRERVNSGKLQLHAWYFDIAQADVYAYEADLDEFVIIDESQAGRIIDRINARNSAT